MENDAKYPNCEMEPKLAKVKKSELRDGMKNDGKYPNYEMEPKLAKEKNPNCEMEWKISKLQDGTNIDNAMCVERSLRAKSH